MTHEQAKQLDQDPKWRAFVEGKTMEWNDGGVWKEDNDNWTVFDFLNHSEKIRIKRVRRELWAVYWGNRVQSVFDAKYAAEIYAAEIDAEKRQFDLVHMIEKEDK